jgi:hypothetical protein
MTYRNIVTNQGEFNPADYDIDRITRIITASVLGDGNLTLAKGCINARYVTSKVVGHDDYLSWIRSVVELLVSTKTYALPAKRSSIRGKDCSVKAQDFLQSRSHPLLTDLHAVYYVDGKKGVPENLELDAEMIAILLMDDGMRCSTAGYIKICTDGLSLNSVEIMQEQFSAVTDLPWAVVKTSRLSKAGEVCYNLRLARRHVEDLTIILSPWIFPSYLYKVGLEPDGITPIPLKIKSI